MANLFICFPRGKEVVGMIHIFLRNTCKFVSKVRYVMRKITH